MKIDGSTLSEYTDGYICAKVRGFTKRQESPDRVLHPMKRIGPKGSGKFERISWEEALGLIARRFKELAPEAVLPFHYDGSNGLITSGGMDERFWNRLGASQLERSICGAAAEKAVEATLGSRWSPDYAEVAHSKLVICWGHNPISTAPHFMPFLTQARKHGARLVVIDPRRTRTAQQADLHLAPMPGSDGALALGLAFAQAQKPAQKPSAEQKRGAYLAKIMDCGGCHTPGALAGKPDEARSLAGSDIGFGIPGLGVFYPPNLTGDAATGLGKWSAAEIVTAGRRTTSTPPSRSSSRANRSLAARTRL